jgi:hypothetical protein
MSGMAPQPLRDIRGGVFDSWFKIGAKEFWLGLNYTAFPHAGYTSGDGQMLDHTNLGLRPKGIQADQLVQIA